jgi:hypothetical protein
MKKKRFDSFLLLILLLGLLTLYYLIASPKNNADQETAPVPTTYSKDARGMKGLYLVLEKLQKDTRRWKRPLPLLEKEEVGTLIVAHPRKPLSPKETKALDSWFSKGGRMLLLHDKDWDIKASGYDQAALSFLDTFKNRSEVFIVKKWSELTNLELKKNPEAGVSIIESIFNHPGPVYFDEYHLYNSETVSPWTLIQQYCNHPVGWATLHIIAVFFLYLLCTQNPRASEESIKNEKIQLIHARASFLELFKAKDFVDHVIDKYRRIKK